MDLRFTTAARGSRAFPPVAAWDDKSWVHRTGDLPWVDPTDEGREVKKQRTVGETMVTRRDTRVG